jgi:hypothetical protein
MRNVKTVIRITPKGLLILAPPRASSPEMKKTFIDFLVNKIRKTSGMTMKKKTIIKINATLKIALGTTVLLGMGKRYDVIVKTIPMKSAKTAMTRSDSLAQFLRRIMPMPVASNQRVSGRYAMTKKKGLECIGKLNVYSSRKNKLPESNKAVKIPKITM